MGEGIGGGGKMGEEFYVNVAIGFGYHFPRSSYPGPSFFSVQSS